MFDLELAQMLPLLAAVDSTLAAVAADVHGFAAALLSMADELESGGG